MLSQLRGLPDGSVIVQPDACLSVSDSLSPCHECHKVKVGAFDAADGAICQFQGFRKIKKVKSTASLRAVMPFEACGFLDPYKDPTQEDKRLWSVNDYQIHPDLDEKTAT